MTFSVTGNIVDVVNRTIFLGTITVAGSKIAEIKAVEKGGDKPQPYILPGFVDAHVHIESSMLVPSEFARLATIHGTVATVSDPHEIANVLGIAGVQFMIDNGKSVPFHFHFGAPSCVPATAFETAGATVTAEEIKQLFASGQSAYLSEMMNYPGVLAADTEVMEKIAAAKEYGYPIDGHAPGLRGADAKRYIDSGISSDHECFMLEEALEKISYGMKIIIREGSAAKNYDALHSLIATHPEVVMFGSDDKHPHELVEGHINALVRRSVKKGYDLMDVLTSACCRPVWHYGLEVGLLQRGDSADFIVVEDLNDFDVKRTYIKGTLVAQEGKSLIPSVTVAPINQFHAGEVSESDFIAPATGQEPLPVIKALDGQIITEAMKAAPKISHRQFVADIDKDILKIAVVNRYQKVKPSLAFIHGFGIKRGAIASTIAHDSHNIIAVATNDKDLCSAINALVEVKGGIATACGSAVHLLPLPVAGLMSVNDGFCLAKEYEAIDKKAKELGSDLHAPFMTLSFMALLVIPALKISDKGLFDAAHFRLL